MRYVVVLYRTTLDLYPDIGVSTETVTLGPFRTRERALQRAAVIRKLAEQYEDPEGVTGKDNALTVWVTPLDRGSLSAQDALDVLYGVQARAGAP